ncbi:c-type cytochrome [Aureivirga sp. CE67]|uniref:c-type cytochrome n=1 Tax=Aureivirga sp. CE67 TaxID=1788983 RepID=UPI0018C8E089|nr:c-type cytochrome [Aureivirga sp. CE67]
MLRKSLAVLAIGLLVVSCGNDKKADKTTPATEPAKTEAVEEKKEEPKKEESTSTDAAADAQGGDIAAGKALFSKKACTACHQEESKLVGPALKDIAKIYNEQNGDMVKFLKGNGKAIVDTDPAQVAVMQANFAVTKTLSDKELEDISAYIKSVK